MTHTFAIEIPGALTQDTFLGVFPLDPLQAGGIRLRHADVGVLARRLEVPTGALLELLGVRGRKEHRELPPGAARDLLRLALVTHATEAVHGDDLARAHVWLTRPRVTLGSPERPRSPLEVALLPGGAAYIARCRAQMRHGISP